MGVLLRFFNLSQPTMKVLFFVALVIPLLWLSLRPNPRLTPIPKPGTDITTVVGQDIMEDIEDTMDGADTTDTPTDTDTVKSCIPKETRNVITFPPIVTLIYFKKTFNHLSQTKTAATIKKLKRKIMNILNQ